MNVVILTNNLIPAFSSNGSSVYLWSLVNRLVKRDFEVHLVSYNVDFTKWQSLLKKNSRDELENILFQSSITPHLYSMKPRTTPAGFKGSYVGRALWPLPENNYVGYHYSEWITNTLTEIKPDVIYPYMVDAVAGVQQYRRQCPAQCTVLITDLDHLVRKYRRVYSKSPTLKTKVRQLRNIIAEREFLPQSLKLLKSCDRVICSAYHHAEWLRRKGVNNIQYFPVPVLDRVGESWLSKRQEAQYPISTPRILMLGNVKGIATLSGLRFIQDQLLPSLDALNQHADFELRIVGGGELEPEMSAIFSKYPWINRVGFVEDIAEEILSSSIVFVPTSIPLGFRTRIAEAFSYGSCVVAHTNNALGMPELLNEHNILLAGNPREMIHAISCCLADPSLRSTLAKNARDTYLEKYKGDVVVDKMLDYSIDKRLSDRGQSE